MHNLIALLSINLNCRIIYHLPNKIYINKLHYNEVEDDIRLWHV